MGTEHKKYTWNLIARKLMGEASVEEIQELETLLKNNPDLHYPMQTIADLWNSHVPGDQRRAELAFNRHLDRIKELNLDLTPSNENNSFLFTRAKRRTVLLTAACSLILVGMIIGLYPKFHRKTVLAQTIASAVKDGNLQTNNGSRTSAVLPDGTKVWLNAGSHMTYNKNFGDSLREISLTGEAYFDVAHNAVKPFIIHTTRIDIRVLGTSFNVKSYPRDKTTEATLIRGSIEVSINSRPDDKIILRPNQKLVVSNSDSALDMTQVSPRRRKVEGLPVAVVKPTYEENTGAIIETSWVDNKLIFQDEAFSELAARMERWYGVTIRFEDPDQKDWHITGSFRNETIQQALDALELTEDFTYTIQNNQITIKDK
jgi:transmembrane sensor